MRVRTTRRARHICNAEARLSHWLGAVVSDADVHPAHLLRLTLAAATAAVGTAATTRSTSNTIPTTSFPTATLTTTTLAAVGSRGGFASPRGLGDGLRTRRELRIQRCSAPTRGREC